jgi:hypothetical protein
MEFQCRKSKEKSDKCHGVGQGANITANTWTAAVGLLMVLLQLHHSPKQIAGKLTTELRQH